MKHAWAALEQRVDRMERARSRDRLASVRIRLWASQILWVLLVIASARFWSSHLDSLHSVLAGMSLHVYGVVAIVLGGIQLRALNAIDYGEPIVTLQHRMAKLIRLRARSSLALGLPWWFLWVPCMICLSGGAFYDPWWVAISFAIGVVGLAITRWFARHTRVFDGLAGRTLQRAARELDDLARF
ncbi:MAG TPA: hypothetical protein VGC41_28100 [Kofleriaceae bacterium]